ncbi:MAG: aminotransferase class IV [Anaerolineae bacterium]
MPNTPTPYAIVNGHLLPASQAGFPAHHQSLVDSFGIYETVLVQAGRFFHLERHLNRLGQSAEILGLDLPAPVAEIGHWGAAAGCHYADTLRPAARGGLWQRRRAWPGLQPVRQALPTAQASQL